MARKNHGASANRTRRLPQFLMCSEEPEIFIELHGCRSGCESRRGGSRFLRRHDIPIAYG
jgi:hypothetical protein